MFIFDPKDFLTVTFCYGLYLLTDFTSYHDTICFVVIYPASASLTRGPRYILSQKRRRGADP